LRIPLTPVLSLVLVLILLSGCSSLPKASPIEGQQREQVLASAEPIADNLFKGMNDADYATFSRDFDTAMKKALDEKAFNDLVQNLGQKIGRYQSRQVEKVEQIQGLDTINYTAQFEKDNPVSVRMILRPATSTTPMQITGLWFDSPKLRAQ
jgi:hypothetical protein